MKIPLNPTFYFGSIGSLTNSQILLPPSRRIKFIQLAVACYNAAANGDGLASFCIRQGTGNYPGSGDTGNGVLLLVQLAFSTAGGAWNQVAWRDVDLPSDSPLFLCGTGVAPSSLFARCLISAV